MAPQLLLVSPEMVDQKESTLEIAVADTSHEPESPLVLRTPEGQDHCCLCIGRLGVCIFIFGFFFLKFARMTDERLAAGPFANTISIFAAPRTIEAGDKLTLEEVVARLRHSGYTNSRTNSMGWYNVRADAIDIFPGPDSYAGGGEPAVLEFSGGKISRIVSLRDHTRAKNVLARAAAHHQSFGPNREKRRLVQFDDIPQSLVHAMIFGRRQALLPALGLRSACAS